MVASDEKYGRREKEWDEKYGRRECWDMDSHIWQWYMTKLFAYWYLFCISFSRVWATYVSSPTPSRALDDGPKTREAQKPNGYGP